MFDELGIGQILCMSSWITTVAAAVSILTGAKKQIKNFLH